MGGSSSCLGVKFEQNSMMIPCLLADRPVAQVKSDNFSKKMFKKYLAKFWFYCRKSDLIISELFVGGSSSCLGVKFEQNSMMIPCLLADRLAAQVKSAKFKKKCSESLLPTITANPLPNEMKK